MCSKRFSLKYTHFFSPCQKNLFRRASHACSVIPRLRPWNLSTVTAAPESLRLRCGLERAKTERHRGLDEQLILLVPLSAGLTSADNARHAASRHRPLHGAHAHFRFRSRARTAAATGRRSAPSFLICGERRSKNAAKLLPLSSPYGREGAGGARRGLMRGSRSCRRRRRSGSCGGRCREGRRGRGLPVRGRAR